MGLPVFVPPVAPAPASKAADKVASGPRSSIRRQPRTARSQPLSVENIRRRVHGMSSDSSQDRYDVWEGIARDQRPSPRRRAGEAPAASRPRGSRFDHEDVSRRMHEGRMRLREAVSFARQPIPNIEIDGPLMPPAPEPREPRDPVLTQSREREITRLLGLWRELRRMAPREPAPTPPYTDTDIERLSRIRSIPRRLSPGTPELSDQPTIEEVETAMAYQDNMVYQEWSERRDRMERQERMLAGETLRERGPGRESPSAAADVTPAMADVSDSLRALSRSLESQRQASADLSERARALDRLSSDLDRSQSFLRQQRLDGLGDRDRSLSPDGGAAWDTLLTGITPDPQPPSVGSSFASTTAAAAATSASASANSGPTSTSTPMTSSGRSMESAALHDCDISESASDSDEEEDMTLLQGMTTTGPNRRPWSSWAEVAAARGERVPLNSNTEDTEHLGGMQRIISRLAERDDIPEEWWRMAGLRREPTS